MKSLRLFTSLTGAGLAMALTLALQLPAQTPPEEPPSPPAVAPEAPTVADEPADAEVPESNRADDLRELSSDPITTAEVDVAVEVTTEDGKLAEDGVSVRVRTVRHPERVGVGSDILHGPGDVAQTVVAIMADAIIDGDVENEAVAILGDLTINGRVDDQAVNILGHLTINGEVEGDVAAVLTSVQLGPNAHIHGDFVSVGGAIRRAPGARIDGDVQEIPFMGDTQVDFNWLKAWVKHCLLWGRPLWFGEHLGWVWMLTGAAFLFYLFIGLIVPRPVARCAQTMEKHPGFSLLTAVLSLLLVPLLMIVLAVTGVGPVLLALFMFFVGIFGKTVFLAWLGRRFFREPDQVAVPLAVLIGGFITVGIYLVPFAGFAFQKLSGFLGTGIVIYTLIQAMQSDRDRGRKAGATAAAAASTATVGGVVPPLRSAEPAADTDPAVRSAPPPPPMPVSDPVPPPMGAAAAMQFSTLPRAGFWPRVGAALLDVILLAIVLNVLDSGWINLTDYFLAWAGLYHVLMWGLKGTTVGGIVFSLKVVRLDDRPMDWSIAIVRGLGSYISLFVLGLGFVWVAFDPERQSWHDKIAGTTIVRVPKGVSLV